MLQNAGGLSESFRCWHEEQRFDIQQAQSPSVVAGFANEGQFLLMNDASLTDLNQRMASQPVSAVQTSNVKHSAIALSRFRPNLLVGGDTIAAYAEDSWQELQIGQHKFSAAGESAAPVKIQCRKFSGVFSRAHLLRFCKW